MTSLRCGAVLCLLVLCVTAAPADWDHIKDEQPETEIVLEDQMFANGHEEVPIDTLLEVDEPDFISAGSPAPSDTSFNQEKDGEEEGKEEVKEGNGLIDYSDYGSLPPWYIQELLGSENDSQSQVDTYRKYKTELDELILDVKLYQVYHSIKTLKRVLDSLIAEERQEDELIRQGAEKESRDVEMGGIDPADIVEPPVTLFTKQLGALKNKGLKPRRVKRDLGWGDDGVPNFAKSDRNDRRSNPRFKAVKYDDEDDLTGYDVSRDESELDGEFAVTKQQIQDLISTFLDEGYSPYYQNDVNINLGDQRMTQEIISPAKRAPRRNNNNREFFARLPTLEGLKKRGHHTQYQRAGHKRGFPDAYSDELPASPPNDQTILRYQIAKLARRLATNSRQRPENGSPEIRDFTNGPAGDINMWFENNPKYNIGIDDNIGDTYGIMETANLPRTSPNEIGALYNDRTGYGPSRLRKRGRIVEEPSLPGPYQGYFMEGQLWHELFNKRSSPESQGFTPKTLKIGGPNAWGNFIFFGDKSEKLSPDEAGEWFSQSFGDDIGNKMEKTDPPTEVEMEGMWLDGDDEGDKQSELTEEEKAWVRRILGYDD